MKRTEVWIIEPTWSWFNTSLFECMAVKLEINCLGQLRGIPAPPIIATFPDASLSARDFPSIGSERVIYLTFEEEILFKMHNLGLENIQAHHYYDLDKIRQGRSYIIR